MTIKFPSGRFLTLNQKCRAMVGAIAGAGRKEKPFLKAGTRAKYMQAHGRLYPTVRGIAQAESITPMEVEGTSTSAGSHQSVGQLHRDARWAISLQERQEGAGARISSSKG